MSYYIFSAAYHSVDPGRVIIKEGHLASCFYFVLSGNGKSFLFIQCTFHVVFLLTVNVMLHSTDDIINTLSAGSSFGVSKVSLLLYFIICFCSQGHCHP